MKKLIQTKNLNSFVERFLFLFCSIIVSLSTTNNYIYPLGGNTGPPVPTPGSEKCCPCPPYNVPTLGNQASSYARPIKDSTILPIELSSFSASVDRNDVTLNWTTASETNNSGFEVERSSIVNDEWSMLGSVKGRGTVTTPSNYTFFDKGLQKGKYNYRLKQIDFNGNFEYFQLSSEVSVGIPTKYNLSQNYPNPFNPVTKIDYDLPYSGKVNIMLYDLLGREVTKLVNEVKELGYYTLEFNAANLSSGVYFYKISATGDKGQQFVAVKKMVVLK